MIGWLEYAELRIDGEKEEPDKQRLRNRYINGMRILLDDNFESFSKKYQSARAGVNFLGDTTTALLTGAILSMV